MNIYIVTIGQYSDKSIAAVFESEELARAFLATNWTLTDEHLGGYSLNDNIEVVDTKEYTENSLVMAGNRYDQNVEYCFNHKTLECEQCEVGATFHEPYLCGMGGYIHVVVKAQETEERTEKAAQDIAAQFKYDCEKGLITSD